MKYVSVCSGIEAASVAWEPLGWKPQMFAEIEPFPRAVLQHHYPNVPLIGDFTQLLPTVDGPPAIALPEADLLVGGTPCQSFSVAGKRLSLEDYRGNLSLAFADLFHFGQFRWGVYENVPGILSVRDNAFGCLLGRLVGADTALAGDRNGKWPRAGVVSGPLATCSWRVADAQFWGVAQRRRRVFVLISRGAGNWAAPAALLPVGVGLSGDLAPRREAGEGTAADAPRSLALRGRDGGATAELGDEVGHAPRASSGGGDKPHVLAPAAFDVRNVTSKANRTRVEDGLPSPTLHSEAMHVLAPTEIVPALTGSGRGTERTERTERTGESRGQDPIVLHAPEISPSNNPSRSPQSSEVTQQVAAVLAAESVVYPLNTQIATRHEALGEGTGFGIGDPGDPAYTLQAGHSYGVVAPAGTAGGTEINNLVVPTLRPRRLTPRECERLQGFPDDYTLIPIHKRNKKAETIAEYHDDIRRGNPVKSKWSADAPRYKALGNSMAVPVMHWIGERIALVERVWALNLPVDLEALGLGEPDQMSLL